MTPEDEAAAYNMDAFKMVNLKKPAEILRNPAAVAVAQQEEDDEFDELPFTAKLPAKPKLAQKQVPAPRKGTDTQTLEPLSVRAS